MSCLNLGKRLLPARKAWRSFTTKLQTKLHNLHNSKSIKKKAPHHKKSAIKKTKYRISAAVLRPSMSFQRKKLLIQQPNNAAVSVRYRRSHVVHKRDAPVYVDELFNESVSKEVQRLHSPVVAAAGGSAKRIKVVDRPAVPAASDGREGGRSCGGDQKMRSTADEMWESVGLASPLMYGIDERAEEFIARFKAGLARGV